MPAAESFRNFQAHHPEANQEEGQQRPRCRNSKREHQVSLNTPPDAKRDIYPQVPAVGVGQLVL